jgi:hypothetical protein
VHTNQLAFEKAFQKAKETSEYYALARLNGKVDVDLGHF